MDIQKIDKRLLIAGAVAVATGALLFWLRRTSGTVEKVTNKLIGMGNSYFTIKELCRTSQKHLDNTPTEEVKKNLQALIDNVLDKAREAYGKPVTVTSGYRSPAVNKAVGGVSNSQHQKGQAADISTGQGKEGNKKLFEIIRSQGNFDQLINEYDYSWVHVSFNPKGNRGEVLRYDGKKYYKMT